MVNHLCGHAAKPPKYELSTEAQARYEAAIVRSLCAACVPKTLDDCLRVLHIESGRKPIGGWASVRDRFALRLAEARVLQNPDGPHGPLAKIIGWALEWTIEECKLYSTMRFPDILEEYAKYVVKRSSSDVSEIARRWKSFKSSLMSADREMRASVEKIVHDAKKGE